MSESPRTSRIASSAATPVLATTDHTNLQLRPTRRESLLLKPYPTEPPVAQQSLGEAIACTRNPKKIDTIDKIVGLNFSQVREFPYSLKNLKQRHLKIGKLLSKLKEPLKDDEIHEESCSDVDSAVYDSESEKKMITLDDVANC